MHTSILKADECLSDLEIVSPESNSNAYRAIIDVDRHNTVHIAWKDKSNIYGSGDDWDIFYKQKEIDGNWSTLEVISFNSVEECSCLSMDSDEEGNIYVAWKERIYGVQGISSSQIFFSERKNEDTWSDQVMISTETNGSANCPFMSVDDFGLIHVVWTDNTNYKQSGEDFDVFYKFRSLNGTWSKTEVVTTNSVSDSSRPFLDIDRNGTIHLVWEEKSSMDDGIIHWNVFYIQKPLKGSWSEKKLLSYDSDADSNRPLVKVDDLGIVHVIWIDQDDMLYSGLDSDIFYKQKNHQDEWSSLELISTESKTAISWSSLSVDTDGNAHIAWVDSTNHLNSGFDTDVYYRLKSKNKTVNPTELISIESENNSAWTWLAVDHTGIVHFCWWDNMDDWVTFYRYKYCISTISEGIDKKDTNNNTTGLSSVFIVLILMMFIYHNRKK